MSYGNLPGLPGGPPYVAPRRSGRVLLPTRIAERLEREDNPPLTHQMQRVIDHFRWGLPVSDPPKLRKVVRYPHA